MLRQFAYGATAIFLASCAPISEEACRGGDWGSIGLSDGKKGRSTAILQKYNETCGEFGIRPNRDLYLQARAAGLKFYCTPENAYRIGRDGSRLNNVCEPQIMASIRPAYDRGARYYEIDRDIEGKKDRIDELQQNLRHLPDQLTPEQSTQAAIYRSRIRDLRHDIFVLETKLRRFDTYP